MKAMMMKRDRSQVHQELKAKGVEFPMTDLDTMVPIRTPRKSHTAQPRPPPQPRPPQQPQAQPLASEVRALALETTFRDNVPRFSVAFLLKGAPLGLAAEAGVTECVAALLEGGAAGPGPARGAGAPARLQDRSWNVFS